MRCHNLCGRELEKVFPESELAGQYNNALHLQLHPGYGEFFDGDQPVNIHLCNECAEVILYELLPNIKEHIYAELEKQGY